MMDNSINVLEEGLNLDLQFEKRNGFKNGMFQNDRPLIVDWVEGSFMLTKKEIWDALDGLDEDYFMYAEDIDFCKRVSNLSYDIYYIAVKYQIKHFKNIKNILSNQKKRNQILMFYEHIYLV